LYCYQGICAQGQDHCRLKKETQFSRNNLSLLSPTDSKLAVWVAYLDIWEQGHCHFFCSRTKVQNWDWKQRALVRIFALYLCKVALWDIFNCKEDNHFVYPI
jgi:hypothetical protein